MGGDVTHTLSFENKGVSVENPWLRSPSSSAEVWPRCPFIFIGVPGEFQPTRSQVKKSPRFMPVKLGTW